MERCFCWAKLGLPRMKPGEHLPMHFSNNHLFEVELILREPAWMRTVQSNLAGSEVITILMGRFRNVANILVKLVWWPFKVLGFILSSPPPPVFFFEVCEDKDLGDLVTCETSGRQRVDRRAIPNCYNCVAFLWAYRTGKNDKDVFFLLYRMNLVCLGTAHGTFNTTKILLHYLW